MCKMSHPTLGSLSGLAIRKPLQLSLVANVYVITRSFIRCEKIRGGLPLKSVVSRSLHHNEVVMISFILNLLIECNLRLSIKGVVCKLVNIYILCT